MYTRPLSRTGRQTTNKHCESYLDMVLTDSPGLPNIGDYNRVQCPQIPLNVL